MPMTFHIHKTRADACSARADACPRGNGTIATGVKRSKRYGFAFERKNKTHLRSHFYAFLAIFSTRRSTTNADPQPFTDLGNDPRLVESERAAGIYPYGARYDFVFTDADRVISEHDLVLADTDVVVPQHDFAGIVLPLEPPAVHADSNADHEGYIPQYRRAGYYRDEGYGFDGPSDGSEGLTVEMFGDALGAPKSAEDGVPRLRGSVRRICRWRKSA